MLNTSNTAGVPIRDILSRADRLAEEGLNDQQKEYVKTIRSCSKSLMTSIDDILAIAALETKTVKVEKNSLRLSDLHGQNRRCVSSPSQREGFAAYGYH